MEEDSSNKSGNHKERDRWILRLDSVYGIAEKDMNDEGGYF